MSNRHCSVPVIMTTYVTDVVSVSLFDVVKCRRRADGREFHTWTVNEKFWSHTCGLEVESCGPLETSVC